MSHQKILKIHATLLFITKFSKLTSIVSKRFFQRTSNNDEELKTRPLDITRLKPNQFQIVWIGVYLRTFRIMS